MTGIGDKLEDAGSFADIDLKKQSLSQESTYEKDIDNCDGNNINQNGARVSFSLTNQEKLLPPPQTPVAALETLSIGPLQTSMFEKCKNGGLDEKGPPKKTEKKGFYRHIVAILALSSIVLANMNRQAFNQALVSMVRPQALIQPTNEPTFSSMDLLIETTTSVSTTEKFMSTTPGLDTTVNETSMVENLDETKDEEDDRFDWSVTQIGLLQAAFSYGYTPFMIPGGRASEIYGAKWVVFVSGFGSALCCVLSPFLADTNFYLLVASRTIMGFCQTAISPSLYALLTRWLAPDESSVYLPMIKVAVMLGFMLGSMVGGFLTWRATFYAVGVIGLLWSLMWSFLVSSDPCDHRFVGQQELDYIRTEINLINKDRKESAGTARKASAPWIKIMTNPVVIAYVLGKFTVKLSTDAQAMQLPMYMKHVFHVSKELNGILNGLNFAIQGLFTGLVAYCAKEFVVRQCFGLNKTGVRRLFQGICNIGMGLAFILLTFNMSLLSVACCAIIMLSVTAMFGSGGEAILPVDLSLDYSASIMAIANSMANLSGIILPQLVSFVLQDELDSAYRWNVVWWIVGIIVIMGGVIFSTRVKAELQDFSKDKEEKVEKESAKGSNIQVQIELGQVEYTNGKLSKQI